MAGEAGQEAGGLIEREPLVAAIVRAIAATAERGSAFAIEGPAGIGKSALLLRARALGEERGIRVLACRGGELEQEFAWGGVRRMLGPLADRAMQAVARPAAAVFDPAAEAGDRATSAVLDGLFWLVSDAAADAPLLLVADDVHWLDEPSRRWLAYLAARIEEVPAVLLAASRTGEPASDDAVWRAVRESAAQVVPAPLSEAGAAALLGRPSAAFARACHRATGGNPFLLRELDGLLRERGVARDDTGARVVDALPPELASRGVTLRLSRLPHPGARVAGAIAVLGPAATVSRAAAAAGLDRQVVLDAVDRLVAAHVLDRSGLRFLHPLMRSAALELAPSARLEQLHREAARLLHGDGEPPETVAGHLLTTSPDGDAWVVERLREAARLALARGAPEEAVRLLRRALAEPPGGRARFEVLAELATAELGTETEMSARRFADALELAERPEDHVRCALGASKALSNLGRFTEAGDAVEAALPVPDLAPDIVGELESALLNNLRWDPASRPRTRPLIERIRARAAAGERLHPLLHANLAVESLAEGIDREGTIRHSRLALTDGLPGDAAHAMTFGILVSPLAMAGCEAEALGLASAAVEHSRANGWTASLTIATSGRSSVRLAIGDVPGAIVDAETSLRQSNDLVARAFAVMFCVTAYIARGDLGAAEQLLAERGLAGAMPSQVWPFPWIQAQRGALRFLRHDLAGARRDLEAFDRWAAGFGIANPAVTWPSWRSLRARVALAVGEGDAAHALATGDLHAARVWGTPAPEAYALRTLGLLAGGEEGLRLLDTAVALGARGPDRLQFAHTLHEHGAALRRANRRSAARDALRQALDLAAECGAAGLVRDVRVELAAAGARPATDRLSGRDSLTPSERRVAEMAADGHSNPQIAQSLFVSRRTVETHLTSAYAKLGLRSRAELRAALG